MRTRGGIEIRPWLTVLEGPSFISLRNVLRIGPNVRGQELS